MIEAHLLNLGAQSCVAQEDDAGYCKSMREQAVYRTGDWDWESFFVSISLWHKTKTHVFLYLAHRNRDNAVNMRRESELFQPLEKTVQF